ncbi:MAG: caspase family protein [Saprospiraceae bacterium]
MKKHISLVILLCLLATAYPSLASHVYGDFSNLQTTTSRPAAIPNLKVVLVICDDYASAENNGIAQSVRVDLATMTQMLGIIEKRGIAKVEKTILQGKKATLANVNTTLKNLNVGADDIIWFYFSGHGGMENGKTFILTADEQTLQRSAIENALKTKPARLKIIMTDACSNAVDGVVAARSFSRGNAQAQEGKFDTVYKDLLYNYQGVLHLSASSEGEYAWSDDSYGGYFTHYFIKENLIKKPSNDWKSMFEDAKQKTVQMFNRMPEEQRRSLAAEGIKSQTPKSFALPTPKTNVVVKPNPTPNTTPTPPAAKAPINIENATSKTITFSIDNNPATGTWSATKVIKKTIAPGAKLPINQNMATVVFNSGGDEYYYELEAGNFFFDYNEDEQLDLFEAVPGKTNTDVSHKDYRKLLMGKWDWETEDGWAVTTYHLNGSYQDKTEDGEILDEGQWEIEKITYEGKTYRILKTLSVDEEENEYEVHYIMSFEDDDTVQLIFLQMFENGEEVELSEDEDTDVALIMYRQ